MGNVQLENTAAGWWSFPSDFQFEKIKKKFFYQYVD